MATKNIKKFYQLSDKPYNYVPHSISNGFPINTPAIAGLMHIDISSGSIYISVGKNNISDWKLLSTGGGAITVETNGTPNPTQNVLNLQEGAGITLTDNGSGTVTIANSAGATKTVINLTADKTISLDNTWSDFLTILELPVTLGNIYSFRMFCIYDIDNTAYGTKWAVSGSIPPVTDGLGYYSYNSPASGVTNTFVYNSANTTFNQPGNVAGTTALGKSNIAIIEGFFQPDSDGYLSPSVTNDGGAGTAGFVLKKGSYIEYTSVPA